VGAPKELLGLLGVDTQEQTTLAACADSHVPVNQEGQAAKHALFGQPLLSLHELPQTVPELLVERHVGIVSYVDIAGLA